MDPLYNYYLDETVAGVSNDFTTIALGTNDMIYIGGNVNVGG